MKDNFVNKTMKWCSLVKAFANLFVFAITGYEISESIDTQKEVQKFDEKLAILQTELKEMTKEYMASSDSAEDLKMALMAIGGALFLLLVWLAVTKLYTFIRKNAKKSARRELSIKP